MKYKLFCMALCLCVFTACEKDEPVVPDKPVVPPTEQPEQPEEPKTPVEPEEPDKPQEPISTDGIINWNNEFIIVGNNMSTTGNKLWKYACYGNGTYVVVGYNEYIAYSNDGGINFNTILYPNDYDPSLPIYPMSICYGNGKFVIIDTYGGSTYSTNGVEWGGRKNIYYEQGASSICYADGRFVAVANKRIYQSSDGINWTINDLKISQSLKSICYADGKFVVMGVDENKDIVLGYSNDLINWNFTYSIARRLMLTNNNNAICYANGTFVAVGNKFIIYSNDGINWNNVEITGEDSSIEWQSVCYANRKFVAVGNIGYYGYIGSSSDGTKWDITEKGKMELYGVCPVQ